MSAGVDMMGLGVGRGGCDGRKDEVAGGVGGGSGQRSRDEVWREGWGFDGQKSFGVIYLFTVDDSLG